MVCRARCWAAGSFFLVAALAAAGAEAAPDPRAVADALVADFTATGKAVASYEKAVADGDTITISGFKATQPDRKGRELVLPAIVVTGAAARPDGGFSVAHMSLDGGSASYRGNTAAWQTATFDDVVIPAADAVKGAGTPIRPYGTATIAGITISGPAFVQPQAIAKVDLAMTADASGAASGLTASTSGVTVPVASLGVPFVREIILGFGYTELVVSANLDVGIDTARNTVNLRSLSVDVADVGKLQASGTFSNVRFHDVLGFEQPGKTAAERTAPLLDGLTVRVVNSGGVDHVIQMQAQMLQIPPDSMIMQWQALLPLMMGDTGGEAFQQKLDAALGEFLKSPKSLTITMAPTAPVPIGKVVQTLRRDRSSFPDLLAVDVTANN